MSDSQTDLHSLLLRKNLMSRWAAFGVLAPLILFLGEPTTFPTAYWPMLLALFWGYCLMVSVPVLVERYPTRWHATTETLFVDLESILAGFWAATFGLDVILIWGILAAGIYNRVPLHGAIGFGRTVVCVALGLTGGALCFEFPLHVSMRIEIALLTFPLFLIFLLIAETKRRSLVRELVDTELASAERAQRIDELNQRIREQILVRYLPPDLIDDIFAGKISMDTKPRSKAITVLFSDLSGFTKMSEEKGAETVSEFLNDYLSVMTETIFAHHGTIDKFIGDAIMVIFGAPVEMSHADQVRNAAQCAIEMQRGMDAVRQKWAPQALDAVEMRVGIHHGVAVVGNFGSKQRLDYTAIGPTVNLASRIESACVPGQVFVSESVQGLLSDAVATDHVGHFALKGIEGQTPLYRLAAEA